MGQKPARRPCQAEAAGMGPCAAEAVPAASGEPPSLFCARHWVRWDAQALQHAIRYGVVTQPELLTA